MLAWQLRDRRQHLFHWELVLWIQINWKHNSLTKENENYHGSQLGAVHLEEKQISFSNHLLNSNYPQQGFSLYSCFLKTFTDSSRLPVLLLPKNITDSSRLPVTTSSPIFPELWTFLNRSKFNYSLLSVLISDIMLPGKPKSQILRSDTYSVQSGKRWVFSPFN